MDGPACAQGRGRQDRHVQALGACRAHPRHGPVRAHLGVRERRGAGHRGAGAAGGRRVVPAQPLELPHGRQRRGGAGQGDGGRGSHARPQRRRGLGRRGPEAGGAEDEAAGLQGPRGEQGHALVDREAPHRLHQGAADDRHELPPEPGQKDAGGEGHAVRAVHPPPAAQEVTRRPEGLLGGLVRRLLLGGRAEQGHGRQHQPPDPEPRPAAVGEAVQGSHRCRSAPLDGPGLDVQQDRLLLLLRRRRPPPRRPRLLRRAMVVQGRGGSDRGGGRYRED
mmetsp:Transcript_31795/g.94500  ORF Transcript_31795/g.94500 Transcript_31795/m.94500 type:complete len:278 (-) Transcript_31795:3-836(-)